MSKHEKHLKRERRKVERGRRRSSGATHGAAALAAAAAIAAGTSAYAEPIRFDNTPGPDYYDWSEGATEGFRFLELTASAADQAEVQTGSSVVFRIFSGSSIATLGSTPQIQSDGYMAVGVDSGTLIPSGSDWSAYYAYHPGYGGSLLPEGQRTYLGARFVEPGSGWHYAWVGVTRAGLELDAFAWGYETEVGVPIAAGVPEPGTLALLACGAAALGRRRRA